MDPTATTTTTTIPGTGHTNASAHPVGFGVTVVLALVGVALNVLPISHPTAKRVIGGGFYIAAADALLWTYNSPSWGLVLASLVGLLFFPAVAIVHQKTPPPVPTPAPQAPVLALTPDPALNWEAGCDHGPVLWFRLWHRLNNIGAMLAFGDFRCTVTDPDRVQTHASGSNVQRGGQLAVQYLPRLFTGAPPLKRGRYEYVWEGERSDGVWQTLARGYCDNTRATFEGPANPDLIISIDDPIIERFRYKAIIVTVKITVENLTGKPKQVQGLLWSLDDPAPWGDNEVAQSVSDCQRQYPMMSGTVPPHDSVSGWGSVALAWDPTGGVGGFTLRIKDEAGAEYRHREEPRGR